MSTIIAFIGGLSVGETAALALGIVAAVLMIPPIVAAMVQRAADVARNCTDRTEYDPEWMDARVYKTLEREERASRVTWRRREGC